MRQEPSETPRPLLRPMTAEEIAARASRSKVQIKKASVKCGVGAALDLREQKLEAEGKESTIGRKKKKKDTNSVQETLKAMKGGHHLLK